MSRTVVLVDAVRTPFGKAGGMYAGTRADDLMVRAIRGLLERNPKVDPASIEDVAIAAATQTGDQGMNIGRSAALLSGLPNTVPGYSIDRWCAGALTAVTTIAGAIAMGTNEIAIAGGADSSSVLPIGVSKKLGRALVDLNKAKTFGQKLAIFRRLGLKDLLPVPPAVAEYSTGLSMGDTAEQMAKSLQEDYESVGAMLKSVNYKPE